MLVTEKLLVVTNTFRLRHLSPTSMLDIYLYHNLPTRLRYIIVYPIPLARFDKRTAPTVISVYNFSGVKPAAKDYVPGSDGVGPAPEMPHYRVEIDAKVWNGTSFKAKQELIEKVEKAPQLDGNGQLYLILQVKRRSNKHEFNCF